MCLPHVREDPQITTDAEELCWRTPPPSQPIRRKRPENVKFIKSRLDFLGDFAGGLVEEAFFKRPIKAK